MKKKILLFALFSVFLSCFNIHDARAYIEKDIAILRVMDKPAGKTQVVSVPVGKSVNHNGLVLDVKNCKQTDPFDAENFFVFVEIYTKSNGRIFSGWMNRNEPGQNPLQNETYDVWLEKCE